MSDSPPLLVRNITNLTDARYFAAWMPEYMLFAPELLADDRLQDMQAIQSWIEGPKWGVELPNHRDLKSTHIGSVMSSFDCLAGSAQQLVMIGDVSKDILTILHSQNDLVHLDLPYTTLIPADSQMLRQVLDKTNGTVWVQIETMSEWQAMESSWTPRCGIAVSGGDEGQPGLKSFDEVDELLEAILKR